MGTGSFPGIKRPGRGVDHPPTTSAEVKEGVEPHLYSALGLHWRLQSFTGKYGQEKNGEQEDIKEGKRNRWTLLKAWH